MKLEEFLAHIGPVLNQELDRLLPAENDESSLVSAMRYSVFSGGKRLRPALFCATAMAFKMDYQPFLPFAAAIEMIHCYSLIHDDLPAMDNDDLRRGKPTCHIVYGDDMAILAGDGLLSLAAEILSRPLPNVPAERQQAAAAEIMAQAFDMVRGQAIEVSVAKKSVDLFLLEKIYEGKTAALFKAAVIGAACLAGATAEQKEALTQYCSQLGLAFQITDDILDVRGDEELIGRKPGSDLKNQKRTYVSLVGCDVAAKIAASAAAKAEEALLGFDSTADILRQYPQFLVNRKF